MRNRGKAKGPTKRIKKNLPSKYSYPKRHRGFGVGWAWLPKEVR